MYSCTQVRAAPGLRIRRDPFSNLHRKAPCQGPIPRLASPAGPDERGVRFRLGAQQADTSLIEFPRRRQIFLWFSKRPPGDVMFRVYTVVVLTAAGIFYSHPDELFNGPIVDGGALLGVFVLITFAVERFLEPLRAFLDLDSVQREEMDKMSSTMGEAIYLLQGLAPSVKSSELMGAARDLGPGMLSTMAESAVASGAKTEKEAREATAKAVTALKEAQRSRINLARVKSNTAAVFWGVASCLSMVLSNVAGVGILHSIGMQNVSIPLDIILTGLAVGAGTKPITELLSKLEEAKPKPPPYY